MGAFGLELQCDCDTPTMKEGISLIVSACAGEEICCLKLVRSYRNLFQKKQIVSATEADAVCKRDVEPKFEFPGEGCCISR